MKTEVKNTKRFWRRGNVLDLAILLILLAAICSIGYRYYAANAHANDTDGEPVQVRFTVESVLPGTADALTSGDILYWESTQQVFGALAMHPQAQGICPVSVSAASELLRDANGNYVNVFVPEGARVDWEGVLNCQGTFNEQNTFLLDGRYTVTPGQKISVYTEKVSFILTVTEIVGA